MSRVLIVTLAVTACCAATRAAPVPKPDAVVLVRQLASADRKERDAAERQLAALRGEPPAELLAALKSTDPDVRRRANRALTAIRTPALLRLPRDQRFAARGRVDLYVASTAALDYPDEDDRHWVPATEFGAKTVLLSETDDDNERKPHGSPTWFSDFATYRKLSWVEGYVRKTGTYERARKNADGGIRLHEAIQAGGVVAEQSISGLVVSRGPVRAAACINEALVLVTGDVTSGHDANSSVIVCDGDVRTKKLSRCVIVARGNITVEGNAQSCTLVAGGKVTITLFQPFEDPNPAHAFLRRVVISEKDANPLGFVRFFELAQVGLTVKVAGDGVAVEAVAAGSAAEKAGLKAGDVVIEARDKKPSDAETLRRSVRDALAVGEATVKVRRGKETLTVQLVLPD
jgi:hypothetical protein